MVMAAILGCGFAFSHDSGQQMAGGSRHVTMKRGRGRPCWINTLRLVLPSRWLLPRPNT
ncbi:hypothetical protein Cadr_000010796 [Camelus dromedarius]|uniref:Uncharacterized protein n=1 Tax=Camelus dromedarius TaxID=9838 RepID=A0A5N4DVG6_CAMDR|nr:hypothetical protein Cadr_000010796 [Camelus dromedarius]